MPPKSIFWHYFSKKFPGAHIPKLRESPSSSKTRHPQLSNLLLPLCVRLYYLSFFMQSNRIASLCMNTLPNNLRCNIFIYKFNFFVYPVSNSNMVVRYVYEECKIAVYELPHQPKCRSDGYQVQGCLQIFLLPATFSNMFSRLFLLAIF